MKINIWGHGTCILSYLYISQGSNLWAAETFGNLKETY